jgi:thiol-disulfide isomerase/thioredoxin
MWLNVTIAVVVGLLAYGATLYFDHADPPKIQTAPVDTTLSIDSPAPDFTFKTLDGKTRALTDFKDKNIILNFWATWCQPCIVEFPALLRIAEQESDTVLIALSSDLNEDAIRKFLKKLEMSPGKNVFIAIDEDARITHGLFQTFKLPETLLIDKNQMLRHKIVGANWTEEDMRAKLKELNP